MEASEMVDEFEPLDENNRAKLLRLEEVVAALTRQVDDSAAASGAMGDCIVRIPNPTGEISKIMMRYFAGNQRSCRYKEFTAGVGIPLDLWAQLPALPIQYRIIPDSKDDIVVRFHLTPGFCYRVIMRTSIADFIRPPESLGFFEVGKQV